MDEVILFGLLEAIWGVNVYLIYRVFIWKF